MRDHDDSVFKRFLRMETYRILKSYKPFLTPVAYRYIKIRLHMTKNVTPGKFHIIFDELPRIQARRDAKKQQA